MPWLKKHNLRIDFPILELKFTLITVPITVSHNISLTVTNSIYKHIAQPTLKYH